MDSTNQTGFKVPINPVPALKKALLKLRAYTPSPIGSGSVLSCCKQAGFNLLELLIGVSIVGTLAAISYPSYKDFVRRADGALAASDIEVFAQAIERFYTAFNRYPDSLAEVGLHTMLDPWGNPYQYLRIHGAGLKGKDKLRKDKSLVPVNSDYDLYSMGEDGVSVPPFTAKASRDDIVRANNGAYVGPAADY
ncbi:MAG: prepilin-type N-terminal cleavage/methylation domain-containing protein [Thiogranum sp.]